MGIISFNDIPKDTDRKKIKDVPNIQQKDTLQIHERIVEEKIEELSPKVIRTRDVNRTWENAMNIGWISNKQYSLGPFDHINGVWKIQPCFIVGSGPDLNEFIEKIGWDFLKDKNTIGINHVIETWDGFKWFLFLDRRFLKRTTYKLHNFAGRIFAQNNAGITNISPNIVRFRCRPNGGESSLRIEKGLYSNRFSGLASLNLAIVSGANPIFLIGFGMGKTGNENLYHFREKYQGVGQRSVAQYHKYINTYKAFNKFKRWFPAITHVTEGAPLVPKMKHIDFDTLKKKYAITTDKKVYQNKGVMPKIVHLSFSNDINVHADITRGIINRCYGDHSLHHISHAPNNADLYITEHFISTNKAVLAFPYKHKTLNIVHSMNCIPIGNFKCNVALTKTWKRYLERKRVSNVVYISGGIDLESYKDIKRNEHRKIFGRITRWSPGKIPPWWNNLVQDILEANHDVSCLFFVDKMNRIRQPLQHSRMLFDNTCKITDFKGDWLKKLSVYVHANNTFRETMSFACIEAMATGLPIVYLKEPAVSEVVGNFGIGVDNPNQLKTAIINLLNDKEVANKYAELSKERAQYFDINVMIDKFDKLIKELV